MLRQRCNRNICLTVRGKKMKIVLFGCEGVALGWYPLVSWCLHDTIICFLSHIYAQKTVNPITWSPLRNPHHPIWALTLFSCPHSSQLGMPLTDHFRPMTEYFRPMTEHFRPITRKDKWWERLFEIQRKNTWAVRFWLFLEWCHVSVIGGFSQ